MTAAAQNSPCAANPTGMVGRTPWSARVPLDPLLANEGTFTQRTGRPTRASAADRGSAPQSQVPGGHMPPLKLPKGAIRPRPAVLAMAPYSPPTSGRAGNLRLDFNENTVGCSPKSSSSSRPTSPPATSPSTRSTPPPKKPSRATSTSRPNSSFFTNGTDEAIQVFINTYIDDGQEVLVLKPAYAMYRFYAEVAGAKITEVAYPQPSMEFPLQQVLDRITPQTRAVILSNPNNPPGPA